MKTCRLCLETKDDTLFSYNRLLCKECRKKQRIEREKQNFLLYKEKRQKKWISHKDQIVARNAKSYARNKDKELARKQLYYQNNKEKIKQYQLLNKESLSQKQKKFAKENADLMAFRSAKRRAAKRLATPKWLSKKDIRRMLAFYRLAKYLTKKTGIRYEVDHIIPLRNKFVQGLNVPWNLQILTKSLNCSKGNRLVS